MAADRTIEHTSRQQGETLRAGRTPANTKKKLEDEIFRLRQTMERTYLEESSLGSDRVIEASRKLDTKINEYMRFMLSCWSG